MSDTALADGFARLHDLGLVNDAELAAIRNDPSLIDLQPGAPLAEHLGWLMIHGIVSHRKMLALVQYWPAAPDDHDVQESLEIARQALAAIEPNIVPLNGAMLDQLVTVGLIGARVRAAIVEIDCPFIFETYGEALAFVVAKNAMTREEFLALRARILDEPLSADSAKRIGWVRQASAALDLDDVNKPRKGRAATLILVAAMVLAVAGMAFNPFGGDDREPAAEQAEAPAEVPACAAPETVRLAEDLADPTQRPRTADELIAESLGKEKPEAPRPPIAVTDVQQVGYAVAHRERGCSATLTIGGVSMPYGFVVGPLPGSSRRIGVMGGDLAMIKARYANIGTDGDFVQKAEPIGRANLKTALRAAVDVFRGPKRHARPELVVPDMPGRNRVNKDRQHEIVDVEPLEACRAEQEGVRYTCRLLVERADPMFATLRVANQVFEAEFTFERDPGGTSWRMSDDFADAYAMLALRSMSEALGRGTKE